MVSASSWAQGREKQTQVLPGEWVRRSEAGTCRSPGRLGTSDGREVQVWQETCRLVALRVTVTEGQLVISCRTGSLLVCPWLAAERQQLSDLGQDQD